MTEAAAGAGGTGLAGRVRRRWWIFSIYYAEGVPYSLVRLKSAAYFKDHGASLQAIGLTSLLRIAWTVKFLWAPLVGSFATQRRWLLLVQAAAPSMCLIPFLALLDDEPQRGVGA